MRNSNKDYLWLIFFLVIFINGFEAGGYQASLLSIGETYDLSTASKGIFASIELFATMLAPLFLGAWADRNNKLRCIRLLLFIQLFFSAMILIIPSRIIFALGIFFLGLTTSALQFISIAALAEVYPASSKRKIGFMTSMYAFGAFIAPLIVSAYLKMGFGWRTLFLLLTITSTIALIGLLRSADGTREKIENKDIDNTATGTFIFGAILLLCIIMCIYVGYENGFAFFIDTLFAEELNSNIGKYALSIFWIIMIPSRVLAGYLGKHSHKILTSAIIAIPVITIIISRLNTDIPVLLLCIPLGFACGAIYPSVLNIAMPLAGNHKATATGMITTATGIGGVVFTALTGIIGDRWGLRTAILILSAFFAISLISALLLNRYSHNTEST